MIPDDVLLGCCIGTMYPDGSAIVSPWCARCWAVMGIVVPPDFDHLTILGEMARAGWSFWLTGGWLCPACTREREKWLTGWEA